uniref:Uncharacterized protein n=1 Tax=Anopheles coluzzii TaxID=1518534 RepID=A0A8W7NYW5_ANOCL
MVRDRSSMVRDRGSVVRDRGSMVVLDSGVSYWSMGIAGHMHGLGDHLVHGLSDLHSRGLTAHDGVESGVMISMVVDDALVTVGVQQRVLSVDFRLRGEFRAGS